MKRTIKFLVFISILAGLTSCSNDVIESTDPVVPEGYIRATLDLQVEKPDSIQTRATQEQEKAYDKSNIWVLMFNATSSSDATPTSLVQAPVRAIESGSQLFVLLRSTTQPVTVYVVTGLSAALNTEMAKAANFTEGVTDLDDLNNLLQTASIDATGVPIGSGSYFHMVSAPGFYSNGTTLLNKITHELTRNVAKINVDASAVASVFELEGVTLVNGAQKGYVFPQATVTPNHGGTMQYAEVTTVSNNKIESQIYLYENTGFLSNGTTKNPTKLVIKGKYNGVSGYYRMDILKDNGGSSYTPYDIKRNCCYTLVVKKIENGGYLTLTEAIASEPSNTWYNVEIDDSNSFDVVSNGHYYLGVSNSEFIVYGNTGKIANLHVATVTTNAPTNTFTSISKFSGDISAVTSSLTAPNGTVTTTDIYATFNSATTSYIDIRVGNLTKRITVRRGAAVSGDGEKTDFIDTKYYKGEVASGTGWVRLAGKTDADFNLSPAVLTKPTGGIYIRYNSALNTSPSSPAEVYVIKTNNQGRAKMLLFTP